MTGVEILATEEVAITASGFNFGVFFSFWFFLMLVGALTGWIAKRNNKADGCLKGLFISCILGFALSAGMAVLPFESEYETQYKVTVSDSVSMNEFLGRYEIIDQEGNIYTIKERADYVESETEEPTEKIGYWTGWEDSSCSECDQFNVLAYVGNYSKYCPNCGVKMEPRENVNKNEKIK